MFLVIDLVPMRRYECFRRRERFLGVLVFAKLIRIPICGAPRRSRVSSCLP